MLADVLAMERAWKEALVRLTRIDEPRIRGRSIDLVVIDDVGPCISTALIRDTRAQVLALTAPSAGARRYWQRRVDWKRRRDWRPS